MNFRFFFGVCCSVATSLSSWDVTAIEQDLNCSSPVPKVLALLSSASQTACGQGHVHVAMSSVSQCVPCDEAAVELGPGYYCKSGQLSLCPDHFYCPDVFQKVACPAGHWCRSGFVEPVKCHLFRPCEEGAGTQSTQTSFMIGFAFIILMLSCCSCGIMVHRVREQDHVKREAARLVGDQSKLGVGFTQDMPTVDLEFSEVGMKLKGSGKCVLHGITGHFPAASLVALMGPSGGGKTTFMNALCGRANYGRVTGEIRVNGEVGGIDRFPKLVGFVPQDDIMHADLTVHQNILYSALLRLPACTGKTQIHEHVNKTLKVLGLEHIAHSLVGDPEKRGISGGQKKRVNIGMELGPMPAVLFMDEPTSGLDGSATIQLAECLHELRKSGLTIICVIHQPRWAVYSQFSHLLLLGAGGRMVYCGEADKVEQYFKGLFFRMPTRENPADWMIDVVCGLVKRYASNEESAAVDQAFVAPTDLFAMWELQCKGKAHENASAAPRAGTAPRLVDRVTPGFIWQTWLFLRREVLKWNKGAFIRTLAMHYAVGYCLGFLFSALLSDEFSYAAFMTRTTGYGSTAIFDMMMTISSRSSFGSERLVFMREFKTGTNIASYWLAKILFGVIPVYLNAVFFSFSLYHTMPQLAMHFTPFSLAVIGSSWYHSGFGIMISLAFADLTTSLIICIFVPMMLNIFWKYYLPDHAGMAALCCGRWFTQEVFLSELDMYPKHVRSFPFVSEDLALFGVTAEDVEATRGQGAMAMFCLGLAMRLVGLHVLYRIKRAESGGCVSSCAIRARAWLARRGLGSLVESATRRGVESFAETERQPGTGRISIVSDEAEGDAEMSERVSAARRRLSLAEPVDAQLQGTPQPRLLSAQGAHAASKTTQMHREPSSCPI